MASTYSALKIELIGTGDQSGTWGTTTNTNLGDAALGEAITGSADVAFSSADVTVTLTDTNATQTARNLRLNLTGTSGGARNLILGSGCQIEKLYLINNGLADAVTVKNTTGTGIAVAAGKSMFVYNNGTNVVDATTYLSSLTLGSALPVASGGTGSTSTTFVNLASNVTGTLPIANGGTGSTSTAYASLTTNVSGTLPIANGGTNATTAPGANANLQTYTTTATAAGTTTLTNTSTYYQYFTGVTTQTVVLPVTSTLSLGWSFHIANNSTGNLTVQSSGLNTVATILPNTTAHITCILITGTTAASWDYGITDFNSAIPVALGGTGLTDTTTAYGVLAAGTTTTGALQNIGVGTTGQILTSNGAGALPTFQASAGGGGLSAYILYGAFTGTASRATSIMTVTAVTNDAIKVGDTIVSTAGTAFGTVSSFGTGTGGIGTYNMSASGTIASTAIVNTNGTFTVPTGITKILVEVLGAGGGCKGGTANSGGGGGGYSKGMLTVTPGASITATVGVGGIGLAGGTTSFGTISATGGGISTTSSAGGTGSGGSLNIDGGIGIYNSAVGYGAGGGGGGTSYTNDSYSCTNASYGGYGVRFGGNAGADSYATGYGNGGGKFYPYATPGTNGIIALTY